MLESGHRNFFVSDYPRYKFTGDTSLGEYNLLISNAQVSDDDFYECQVTKYGLRSGKVKLTVEGMLNLCSYPWNVVLLRSASELSVLLAQCISTTCSSCSQTGKRAVKCICQVNNAEATRPLNLLPVALQRAARPR